MKPLEELAAMLKQDLRTRGRGDERIILQYLRAVEERGREERTKLVRQIADQNLRLAVSESDSNRLHVYMSHAEWKMHRTADGGWIMRNAIRQEETAEYLEYRDAIDAAIELIREARLVASALPEHQP